MAAAKSHIERARIAYSVCGRRLADVTVAPSSREATCAACQKNKGLYWLKEDATA